MKAEKEHRVPLSEPAIELLMSIQTNTRPQSYIDPTQNRVITTHGFCSTSLDWSADKTDYSREVCKHVLAHKLPDEVEAAYLHEAYIEKRKSLMADWAKFCTTYFK